MNLPQSKETDNSNNKILSLVFFSMLVLIVLGISFVTYLKSKDIDIKNVKVNELLKGDIIFKSPEKKFMNISQIDYNSKNPPVFEIYKGEIVKGASGGVKIIDKTGQTVMEKSLPISNPIVKTNNVELLIADAGGKEVYLLKDKEVKWNVKVDNNIINADISQNGYVTIVHEAKGYKGAVSVYNFQGERLFTRNIAEGFIISAGALSKSKEIVINTLDSNGVKSNSGIELIDINGKPIGEKTLYEDSLFPSVLYMDNESVAAVSANLAVCINKDGREKWKSLFEEREIYSACVFGGKNLVLAVADEEKGGMFSGGLTQIVLINSDGKQTKIMDMDGKVKDVQAKDDYIAVNTGREVVFITGKGKVINKYSSKMDVVGVKFLNKQEAAVITKSSIDVIKVNQFYDIKR